MIYLDNAATSVMRPQCVVDAVCRAMTTIGNPSRGACAESLDAGRVVWECRERLASLLGCARPDHVCFAPNSTAALNTAINGLVRPGAHVVTTVMEHNSVLRPLNRLAAERGVRVEHAGTDELGRLGYDDLRRLCAGGCDVVVCTHASNVTGNVVDLRLVSQIAHDAGALLIVDASQSAGCIPIDMGEMGIDVVCFTGHKGLMGPQGTGGLAVAEGIDVRPWNMGGTGVSSFEPLQPEGWPTRLEAGTLNAHGIAGLSAALEYLEKAGGPKAVGEHERALDAAFAEGVRGLPGITLYGDLGQPARAAIVSLNVGELDSGEVSDMLSQAFGIATRPGAHCAPLMHRALGTEQRGVVRFSFGWFNTQEDVAAATDAVSEIACG